MHNLFITKVEPCNFGNDWGLYIDFENMNHNHANWYEDNDKLNKNYTHNCCIVDCLPCIYNESDYYNDYFEERFDEYNYYPKKDNNNIISQTQLNTICNNKLNINKSNTLFTIIRLGSPVIISTLMAYIFCVL